ncbi:MAG: FtsX-like permease family protein [Deltaproteobacteria bacterium]|nr:FtsX-like permease family protein [Deltaproteobacteria bacterium]
MLTLFRGFTLPYWRRRALKTFLTLIGMASGIAVYTAIDLSNHSALRSFEGSVSRISGQADLSIIGKNRRLADADFERALANPHTLAATPLLEAQGLCGSPASTSFTLLGIDPMSRGAFFSGGTKTAKGASFLRLMSEPRLAIVPQGMAARCGIQDGKDFQVLLRGRPVSLHAEIDKDGDPSMADAPLIFVDIATAQESLEEIGGLSRIEIKTNPDQGSEWRKSAEHLFPSGLAFRGQEESLGRGRELLRAFQLNLLSLALVAVFVAVFIVYNSASLSVLHRRADLAVLRSLGATRSSIAGAFLLEVLVLGLLSGALGVLLGWLLALAIFGEVAQTIRHLYLGGTELRLYSDAGSWMKALGLSLAASVLGAAVPLAEVFRVSPAEAVRKLSYERHLRHHPFILLAIAAAMLVAAIVSARLSSIQHPGWGFLTAFAVLSGFLTLTPSVLKTVLEALGRIVQRLRQAAEALPGVERRDMLRVVPVQFGNEELRVSAVELGELMRKGQFQLLAGKASDFQIETPEPGAASVSESFARRKGLKLGDSFQVSTSWGPWNLQLRAILYDYSSERGIIYVERRDFARFSGDPRVQGLALYLKGPSRVDSLAQQVRTWPSAPPTLETRSNRDVRDRVLRIFDETFQVTEALKLVALFVSFLGILTTLSILLEEKRREVGLLQALGMSPAQLAGYAFSQGAALGLCGWILGALCGIALCWVIIRVINYDHFGWTIYFSLDWGLVAASFALTLFVATLATLWPMIYLARIQPAEALRFED